MKAGRKFTTEQDYWEFHHKYMNERGHNFQTIEEVKQYFNQFKEQNKVEISGKRP